MRRPRVRRKPPRRGAARRPALSASLAASWEFDLWGVSGAALRPVTPVPPPARPIWLPPRPACGRNWPPATAPAFARRPARAAGGSVEAYERSLKLTQNRYDAGVVARSDVAQAQFAVAQRQAQLIDTDNQRAALEHAIDPARPRTVRHSRWNAANLRLETTVAVAHRCPPSFAQKAGRRRR